MAFVCGTFKFGAGSRLAVERTSAVPMYLARTPLPKDKPEPAVPEVPEVPEAEEETTPAATTLLDMNTVRLTAAPTRLGVIPSQLVRIEVDGLSAKFNNGKVGKSQGKLYKTSSACSKFPRTKAAYIVSIDDMSKKLKVLLQNGAKVSSVTSVVDTLNVPYFED